MLNSKKIYMFWLKSIRNLLRRYHLAKASPTKRAELLRPLVYHMGKDVELYTSNLGTEPYLISIHDNVCVASNVHFITHDVSVFRISHMMGLKRGEIDKVGSIELHDNSFIGAYSILMPNTSVGKNSVVAAGSLVTKHIPDNEVWGGVPAKFICATDSYAKKTA